jgi:ribonuclease HII
VPGKLPNKLPQGSALDLSSLDLGVDEAGRGPILGPMVLACVALDAKATAALTALGVADSKSFGAGERAHAARVALCEPIHRHAAHIGVAVVAVAEIDARASCGQLNHLEREHAERLIAAAPPAARIIADGARLFSPLRTRFPHLLAMDRAESQNVAVAAASLIAKVRRDELWLAICQRYRAEFGEHLDGHAGGGYPNAATRRFLRAYCARYRRPPPEGRRSWPWAFAADLIDGNGGPLPDKPLDLPGLD